MEDLSGRTIDYMRISVTDRCNLRCKYCMPSGVETVPMSEILTFEEIREIVSAGSKLGIKHIKLTGGEPLVRRGISQLIKMIKSVDGIEDVSITTNGILLKEQLPKLIEAGLDAVNISLDTLDRHEFKEITGFDCFEQVMEGIEAAIASGITTKINVVTLPNTDFMGLIKLCQNKKVDVRFIEMMPIGLGKKITSSSNEVFISLLQGIYPNLRRDMGVHGNGPAVYYKVPGFLGSIGFISAMHGKFCGSCNRIRISSKGYLKSCLCYENGVDLMAILRSDSNEKMLISAMEEAIYNKPLSHCFENIEKITESRYMASIGG